MKRILLLIGCGVILLSACALFVIWIFIGQSVNKNIDVAKERYPGSPEDALIAFLMDGDNAAADRTHTAIWTLGQIKSEKALPILKELYNEDPEGRTCYGKHDSMLCQCEIHKALVAIEGRSPFTHAWMK